MSTQSILFVLVCAIAFFLMPDTAQHYIGLFATGWLISDLATMFFPKKG